MTHPTFGLSPELVAALRTRPPSRRTDKPYVGEVLGWRAQPGGPVVRAKVLRVNDEKPADTRAGMPVDWNVWRYVQPAPGAKPIEDLLGNRLIELVDDPWWDVRLETVDGPPIRVETREERLAGAGGWLRGRE